ncbi:MAG: FABP family protein [Oligoflexia bacterium]|nr:FABP family protein [Oligoflexia bacterium]
MEHIEYGPLRFLIGKWKSEGFDGENRAPDPDRRVENTKFRQEMTFEPIGDVENHEQLLYALRYSTLAWEEGDDEEPFHEEVGYFIWDKANRQVMKSFIVPRGIAVQAGGEADVNATEFSMKADLGSQTYGLCSNKFLDEEFQTVSYEIKFEFLDEDKFLYDENTRIKIKGQDQIFDHTEKNTLCKVK